MTAAERSLPPSPPSERVPLGIRWSRVLVVLVVVAVGTALYLISEWRKTDALRKEILGAYDQTVEGYRNPVRRLDRRIASLVRKAAAPYVRDHHDPIFRVGALQKGQGIYARIPLDAARSDEQIRYAARRQSRDAFAGCLGVNPALYGRLLVFGDLVGGQFRSKILEAGNVARLRALDQDFVLRARRDLPRLAEILRPDYLIVMVEETSRGSEGFRVFVWDLHTGRELARVRAGREVEVVNVRWSGQGVVPSKRKAEPAVLNTARDCAIASALREVSGDRVPTVSRP